MPPQSHPAKHDERLPSDIDSLRAIPLLASLSDAAMSAERHLFRKRAVAKGAFIFLEGDPPERFYILLKGQVKLIRSSEGKDLILRIVTPGEWFGGVAAFGRRAHPYTAQAMEPSVVMTISGPDFADLLARYPDVSHHIIEGLVTQLTDAHEMMRRLALEPVEPRLAHTLLDLASRRAVRQDQRLTLTLNLTRQTLADMSGTTVETTIRVLSKWRRAGLVREENGVLVIADPAALEAIAHRT
ncbi:MAG: Crp/Fnr family transcriptional regulator [Anaerolineae bacterium]